mmetsp:Transcript_22247/g.44804  ORF Transcript_22247/g.44804 Transcript_22247/m.44804 type:complete len:228 (+) Transcript_22247:575-1258(+)
MTWHGGTETRCCLQRRAGWRGWTARTGRLWRLTRRWRAFCTLLRRTRTACGGRATRSGPTAARGCCVGRRSLTLCTRSRRRTWSRPATPSCTPPPSAAPPARPGQSGPSLSSTTPGSTACPSSSPPAHPTSPRPSSLAPSSSSSARPSPSQSPPGPPLMPSRSPAAARSSLSRGLSARTSRALPPPGSELEQVELEPPAGSVRAWPATQCQSAALTSAWGQRFPACN